MGAAWLVPVLPAASAVAILAFGKRLSARGAELGILAVGAAFVLSVVAAVRVFSGNVAAVADGSPAFLATAGVPWLPLGGETLEATLRLDGLSAMMLLLVTAVSLAVHVYSLGYMHDDPRRTWYFTVLSLFTASMLLLVLAESLLLLVIGWELVGVCSFLLIGFWWEHRYVQNAAIKAFLTTKAGDVGLVVGVIALAVQFGTFDITSILDMATAGEQAGGAPLSTGLLTFALLALVLGVIGKSAQLPLHTWLPDAMAGPTPVSALIHAATMVTAGVFLIARLYPLFGLVPAAQATIAIIGAATLLAAGLLAFVQDDVKKVLAYSTVSQLGYMVAGLAFSYTAGIFHLFTHGFFKALLFLGAGSLIHAAGSNDLSKMGGLRRAMPVTFATFVVGTLALMAIPPLAGFWSKDEILAEAALAGSATGWIVLVVGALGGALTVAYMARVLYLAFAGEFRGEGHPHESPRSMTGPLVALAIPSALIGLVNLPFPGVQPVSFSAWTTFDTAYWQANPIEFQPTVAAVAVGLALVGFLAARAVYAKPERRADDPLLAPHTLTLPLRERYWLDHLWTDLVTRTIVRDWGGWLAYAIDRRVIEPIVRGAGTGSVAFGRALYGGVDLGTIDGFLHGLAGSARGLGARVRLAQSGNVQLYAAAMLAGITLLTIVLALT